MPATLPGVRAVTYDLWLTLLVDDDPRRTHRLRAQALADLLGASLQTAEELLRGAGFELHAAWQRGRALTVHDLAAIILSEAGRDHDEVAAVVSALDSATSHAGVRLLPGAREVLRALRTAGLPLALICDTGLSSGARLRALLDELGVLDAFAVTVFSDETGVPKPGGRPFALALEGVGVPAGDAVHVGDKRRRDVAGAVSAGMCAVRYRGALDDPDEAPDAPYVLDRHEQLLELLGL